MRARERAVKRCTCTVKYAVIESDVLALLLRDFVLGGEGMKMGSWLRENLRKMRCFLGGAIGSYIVEEGRRERAGGGGEEKKKRDAGEPFFYCVCFGL